MLSQVKHVENLFFHCTFLADLRTMFISIPPESVRKPEVFWRFQRVKKWKIGFKWVNTIKKTFSCNTFQHSVAFHVVETIHLICTTSGLKWVKRTRSKCGKIRTRNYSVFGHFSRSGTLGPPYLMQCIII